MIKVIPGNNRLSHALAMQHLLQTTVQRGRELQSREFYKLHSQPEQN